MVRYWLRGVARTGGAAVRGAATPKGAGPWKPRRSGMMDASRCALCMEGRTQVVGRGRAIGHSFAGGAGTRTRDLSPPPHAPERKRTTFASANVLAGRDQAHRAQARPYT